MYHAINYNSNELQHLACWWIAGAFACHKFDIKLLLMNCKMLQWTNSYFIKYSWFWANLGCENIEANESNHRNDRLFPQTFWTVRMLLLQLLLCTKNKFLATSTLMSLLMKAGLSLNVFWQGPSKPLSCVVDLFHVPRHSVV